MTRAHSEALARVGEEAQVQVNQRALIDKVLARYPGEFTLFRELLQNSDDAGSTTVEICFETAEYQGRAQKENASPTLTLPDLKSTQVVQWTCRNNGKTFSPKDWERLPRIADGNPSPEKIGAFGVGFYSLFFVTESPCVTSGGYGMKFYWKNNDDQLYVRRGSLPPNETPDPWTTFEMPLREPGPMPSPSDLMQFLASSITFMVNLRNVNVLFDGHHVGCIKKSPGPSQPISVPTDMERSSPGGIMRVKDVQCRRVTIEAKVMDTIYLCSGTNGPPSEETVGSRENQHAMVASRVDLTVFTAEVAATVKEELSKQLTRCLKKQPPSQLKYGLIYTGKDEYDQSSVDERGASIFCGLRADLEWAKNTHIFIGHATGQTTGIGGHMASHFIPTVERETIDLVNSGVSVWNKELLYVGGFLSRAVYEMELSEIQRLWEEEAIGDSDSRPSLECQDHLYRRFLHVLKFFSFHHSTPSPKVSRILRDSFYQCSVAPLRLLSTVGVRASPNIRAFDPDVAKFLKSLPMLPELNLEAAPTIRFLPAPHKICPITVQDVLRGLARHPLSQEELVVCLQWSTLKRNKSSLNPVELFEVVFLSLSGAGGTVNPLSSMKSFVDQKGLGSHIPLEGPLPTSLIPRSISMHFIRSDLVNFGWREFTVTDWFEHISCTEVIDQDPTYDFTKSAAWAERVLCTLSFVWSSLSEHERRAVKGRFTDKNCIPTSHGLCRPEGSYLPIANDALFGSLNLPVVTLTSGFKSGGEMRSMLSYLGVRTRIPLELLLTRQVGPSWMLDTGNWSTSDLISYLVRLAPPLTPQDIATFKSFKLFCKECPEEENIRYCADELYPPVEIFRQLQLPVVDWGNKPKWSNESVETKLVYRLGLRRYPALEVVIDLCRSPDKTLKETAFTYLCDNLRSKYSGYNPETFKDVEFIPAENNEGTCLKKPGDVFLGTQWKALGVSIVQSSHQKAMISELGVKQNPPPSILLHLLERTRPPNEETARQWYECLSDCIQEFTQADLTRLSVLPIVPTTSSGTREWLAPAQCYQAPSANEFHSKLFVFVDFGRKAHRFLSACGLRKEPSVKDIAESLVNDPEKFCHLAGGHEGFLEKLRDLATRATSIPNDTLHKMSYRRTLLGERRERIDDQTGWRTVYELRTPREIVIVDDSRDYALFSDAIFVAPEGDLLERFYSSMGCRRLSNVVQEKYEESFEIPDSETCTEVQTLVLKRLPLFLQKCPHARYDKMRVPSADNFSVAVCDRLLVHKSLIIGDDNTPRKQIPWALTKYNKDAGKIELWLSRQAKRDVYGLAASLCRLLFETVRANDALLLATMLSDVELLKQAGFDVNDAAKQHPSQSTSDSTTDGSIITGDSHSSTHGPAEGPLDYIRPSIADTIHSAYYVAKGRLVSSPQLSNSSMNAVFLSSSSWAPRRVMPQSYIRNVVNKASEACNSDGRHLLDNQDHVNRLLKHQSCNDFRKIGSLRCLGSWESIEVHVAEDYPKIDTFMMDKHEPLVRFIRILSPAASAHKLPTGSLHVFHDVGDGPIAFNREGSIYLNLRYYEEWHDKDVKNGVLRQAQLSWFFALAHEIAHNVIQTHDFAHEFWFAAICEAHIGNFFAATAVSESGAQSDLTIGQTLPS